MAITKTNFINYTRCRRYSALEKITNDKKTSKMTIEEYKNEELEDDAKEILSSIFEMDENGEEIDKTEVTDIQLEAMMEYYKEIELIAGIISEKKFGGKSTYSLDTYSQESFDFVKNGIRYLCYVDIYNETDNELNIIEIKATTDKKYRDMEYVKNEKSMFYEKDGILYLENNITDDKELKKYNTKLNRLKNRNTSEGKYIYDLSLQRYIIENDFLTHDIKPKKVNYYLGVLNSNYIYDGYTEEGKRVYKKDENGNEIITFIDLNDLTKDMQSIIDSDRKLLESYLKEEDSSPCNVGVYCAYKSRGECIYKPLCFKDVPSKNASFNYVNFRQFKDESGVVYNKYDLINSGYLKLDDIPHSWITNETHKIERDCYDNNKEYIDKEKIKAGIESLSYPIYHLDFETFPCPLPRFKGEKPYTQSVFEFSLHIEREPGICDKDKDNIVYINRTTGDEREELVKLLVNSITDYNGTMLAQNVGFEKSRIKELAEIFPQYKKELMKIYDMGFDLLYLVKNNKELYESLGFDEERCNVINYYHKDLSGSYSIKKTLPVFSDLKYTDLEIQNGTQALVEYSKYKYMNPSQLERTINALIVYCKQDTWAMVEILNKLRELVK